MKTTELRELTGTELQEKLLEFQKELFNLRFQHKTAQLENTQRLPFVRKTVARILTVMREQNAGARS
ncbi:large subunit ribosomal protein L29 [Desulfonatronum thiosulfatophilum]|uniref:Large ribosomal subunit protein uL29 n=1 Tax=Desulfonatronum thiosulfatophilum TaxID=617002 RepID=A0A1G6BM82_9BACT|nr:50S ribosomal protein L29 [Desulfonatronum thiosulfatophilum]SDB21740.1 large subunit ribosomal protein L29 [Desulfonatronum thiosulfatophilum]